MKEVDESVASSMNIDMKNINIFISFSLNKIELSCSAFLTELIISLVVIIFIDVSINNVLNLHPILVLRINVLKSAL